MYGYHNVVMLIVVRNIDVFDLEQGCNLVQTIGQFPDLESARTFRAAIMLMLEHGDSAVIISTDAKRQVVYHDVETVKDLAHNGN